ncbi:NUDIX hydrolase [Pseudomonas viridiflava]|nr:NUDIX hydrolase [Pseudomonas viridiflava]
MRPKLPDEILFECNFFKIERINNYFVLTEKSLINGAVIVAENDNLEVLLVRHFRPAINAYSIEFPRGGRDKDEPLEKTAERELLEETGIGAKSFIEIGEMHSNTSVIRSSLKIFKATGAYVMTNETDGEIDEQFFVSRAQLKKMLRNGEITDAHTLSAIAFME